MSGDDDRRGLRRRTARGGLTNALFMGGAEGLVLVQGLVVTALLGPVAIGLYGIVTTTAMTVVQLRRVGIDEAFVQQTEADQEEEFQRAFTLELAVALAFSLVLAALAPVLAAAYGEDELLALTLAVAYLPVAFALQAPGWIFFRRMDFLRVRILQTTVPVVSVCITLPLALTGVGVWSLVIGPAVGNLAGVLAAVRMSPYRLRLRFSAAARRRYFRFSWPIFATAAAVLVVQQGQVFAFELEGGLAAAGYITLAFTLTRYADRADHIVATTIYPAICRVRDQIATLEELFVKVNRLALMWVLPFCAGFVLFAPDLVEIALGERWRPAVVLLQGLAVAAGVQQLGYNWFSFYRARGESSPQAVESAVLVGTFVVLAVPGLALFGAGGFVAGRVLGALAGLAVRRHYVRRLLPRVELLAVAARGLAPVLGAAAAALALRGLLWGGGRPPLQVAVEVALFLLGTAALTWALERPLLRELVAELRTRRLRGGPAAVPEDPTAPGVGDPLGPAPAGPDEGAAQPAAAAASTGTRTS